ncbi:MAG: stage V sporulation protein AD [Eubacteriales bacterium]
MQKLWSLPCPPRIFMAASAVGKEEYRGPLGEKFDYHDDTDRFGGDTWEHAEEGLAYKTLTLALNKAHLLPESLDLLLAGDLQNQCVATSTGLLPFGAPFLGLYGACSTAGLGLLVAALALAATDAVRTAAVVTTSHNCAAERQFRTPLEYGAQRTPTAQWTATAGGAFLLARDRGRVALPALMAGRVVDSGLSDAANMGAAMAPAAADSLLCYFAQSGDSPAAYDAVVTGDLGREGSAMLSYLLEGQGLFLGEKHLDCGKLLYDFNRQDVHAGGSGCGCSAAVLAAHFLPLLESGAMRNILFIATGALMSPSSLQQGGRVLGIAPAVRLSHVEESDG